MNSAPHGFRISAATGLHKGDRAYQQDQVEIFTHPRVAGCALAVVADGMGGKSGGRTAADQVVMTAKQVFDRFNPSIENPEAMLRQLVVEAHLMIKLTAITADEEPHSTIAAFMLLPNRTAYTVHAGDSRVYHFRGADMLRRTTDHSYVQRLIDEGKITEAQANAHPQSNLLTGCLGTQQDPPVEVMAIEHVAITNALSPREASEMMISKARQRARGTGDNLCMAIMRVEALAPGH